MKVCIVGAGAIGGFIGARLAAAGQCDVSALARGATLAALQAHGWRLQEGGALLQRPARAEADPQRLGLQDLVVIAVKGPALSSLAPSLAPLIGPDTVLLPAMNGVPWWFCDRVPGWDGRPIESVDPGGRIAAALPAAQVLGCVVHASASTSAPGVVQHAMGQGLIVGEPAGGASARARRVADLLAQAGFAATVSADIRYDIWYKLWGNLTMNPLSAVTGATMDRLLDDEDLRGFCAQAMRETAAVGAAIDCSVAQTPEERFAVTRKLGAFRTSMLQDVEAGRPMELDAIVSAVQEIARRRGVATPAVDALLGIARVFGQVHGLYPQNAKTPAAG
ncbi:2-dehydropantoate 2-reductase [Xylophilus sp. Leaf220]|uniref:2-dehydropantoate 2-reductase n=1 Tax=Xylophilus sp. Leaf220 TaxID=1735686 RepID=UPI0006F9E43D|nr:2-dehydropantoate 2-reductase [Xylophilus sp. Leaf220]KQM75681.1 2-dehydropantoate 2-reductase [Xylophilus sp. Leaf220]